MLCAAFIRIQTFFDEFAGITVASALNVNAESELESDPIVTEVVVGLLTVTERLSLIPAGFDPKPIVLVERITCEKETELPESRQARRRNVGFKVDCELI